MKITDVGLSILDPISGELFSVEGRLPAPIAAAPEPTSTCRFPLAIDPFRLCILRSGHAGGCLPAPAR